MRPKISKVWHKEAIYWQTRQILSKTKAECRRRHRFLIAVILCYNKINKYRIWVCGAKTKLAKFHTRKPIYGQTSQILLKTKAECRRRPRFLIAVILFYIKINKYRIWVCGAKTKLAKFHTRKPIYGLTHQIVSKSKTEGRRRLQFTIAGILCYIKRNKCKNLSLRSDRKLAKFHTRKPSMDKLVK